MPTINYFLPFQDQSAQPLARYTNHWFFTAPIEGVDMETGLFPEDPAEQAKHAFANLKNLLTQANLTTDAIGHIMVWQKDRDYRYPLNEQWEAMFPEKNNRPARHVVLRDWQSDALIKLEVIAIGGESRQTIIDMPGAALGGGANKGFIPLAAVLGDVLFSGAIAGWNVLDGTEPDDPQIQTNHTFANIESLLKIAGFTMQDIAHMFVWQRDLAFKTFTHNCWRKYFTSQNKQPVRHTIEVALPLNLATQLEIIAIRNQVASTSDISTQHQKNNLPSSVTKNNVLFTAAISGLSNDKKRLPSNINDEISTVFKNTLAILNKAKITAENIAHIYVWKLSNAHDAIIEQQWNNVWPNSRQSPIRHDVITKLADGAQLKLEVTAIIPVINEGA